MCKKILLTKKLLSSHTTMPNYGVPGCANQSNTHSEKRFHRLPIISKKKKKKKKKKKGGASESKKLIENHFQKNYLSTQTTLNLNVFKGMSW